MPEYMTPFQSSPVNTYSNICEIVISGRNHWQNENRAKGQQLTRKMVNMAEPKSSKLRRGLSLGSKSKLAGRSGRGAMRLAVAHLAQLDVEACITTADTRLRTPVDNNFATDSHRPPNSCMPRSARITRKITSSKSSAKTDPTDATSAALKSLTSSQYVGNSRKTRSSL